MSFWTIFFIIIFVIAAILAIIDEAELLIWVVLGYILYVMYGPLFFMTVDIIQDGRQIYKKSPNIEGYHQIIFIDSLETEIPGQVLSPYLVEYVCPFVPESFSGINTDIKYRVDVSHADVEYSPFFTNEGNGTYSFMGTSIDEGTKIAGPIVSITNYNDDTKVEVTLNARWSRCFVDNERIIALKSKICYVPREQGQTFEEWQLLCNDKLDTMTIVGRYVIFYMSDKWGSRMIARPSDEKHISSEIKSYLTQDLPKVNRSINLRQDLYKNTVDSINVTKVEVSSVVDGGLLADVYFDPITEARPVTVLYQYYTKAEDTKEAYKSDFAYTRLYPGQDHLQIFVEEGYDQFALVAIAGADISSLVKDNSSRLDLILSHLDYDYAGAINDYTTLHYDNYYNSYLLVDHREGFWQKLFYSKYTNDVDWLTTILISITGLGVIALVVWFVIRKFKK